MPQGGKPSERAEAAAAELERHAERNVGSIASESRAEARELRAFVMEAESERAMHAAGARATAAHWAWSCSLL